MSNFSFILLGCLVSSNVSCSFIFFDRRNGGGRSPSFLLLSCMCPPVFAVLCLAVLKFSGTCGAFFQMLFGRFPQLLFAFDLSPNIFTLVSQFLHFSGTFGTGFRKGFWICLIVEWHTQKESKAPIHLHSTEKDQSCSVAIVGVFFELVCVARLKMLAHWNLKDGRFIKAFKPSAKSLFQDGQPWIVLNRHNEIIETRMSLPKGPHMIRWAVWYW